MALAHGEAQPLELIRWTMAERFGWSLEYIDHLPLAKLQEYLQIQDGRSKANESIANRKGK